MSTHPWMRYEVESLRQEELLVRAYAHHAGPGADEVAPGRRRTALERLFALPRSRARTSARVATGAARPLF